uniref:Uncharacterized protein n=1 Tax=viral metagenome TaxID=1070528 RepID=A0A6C0HRQ7_9ZZZZ
MNVSDEKYRKMKSALVMSIREAIRVTHDFGLDEEQIVEFDIKESINMLLCLLSFPSEVAELIELQEYIFKRHCLMIDIHDQLTFVVKWNPKWKLRE